MNQNIDEKLIALGVFTEVVAIFNELQQYKQCQDKICYAMNLLRRTQNYLISIKHKLGSDNQVYINMSTEIVSNALDKIIVDVNDAQKEKSESYLIQVLHSAWDATKLMDEFDIADSFATYYLSNKKTLSEMCQHIIWSDSAYNDLLKIYRAIDIFENKFKEVEDPFSDETGALSNETTPDGIGTLIQSLPLNKLFPSFIDSSKVNSMLAKTCKEFKFQNVKELLKKCELPLNDIKANPDVSKIDCQKLSTRVISIALDNVIRIVNYELKDSPVGYRYNMDLHSILLDAFRVMSKMHKFDIEPAFNQHLVKQTEELRVLYNKLTPGIYNI